MIKTIAMALLAMTMAACGDGTNDADAFIGTWTYNAGSVNNTDCPDNQFDSVDPQTGSFQVTAGIDSDLIVVGGTITCSVTTTLAVTKAGN